jgi:trehalose 6-phosphate phosphatase
LCVAKVELSASEHLIWLGVKESDGGVDELNPVDLRPQQIGLFLDVDGTLLDLAPSPEAVEVPAGLLDTLAAAERCLDGALALVSGRPIEQLDRLFAPLRLRSSGVHGAQIRQSADGASRWLTQARLPDRAWPDLLRLLDAYPGTLAENKGISFAVHYRNSAASEEELVVALGHFIEAFVELDLELIAGHRVFEIRLPGFDKGKAIDRFMAGEPFAGRRPVFVADDRMDRAGFDAALALGGLAFSVGAALPGLSGWFARPQTVRAWVGRLAR